MWDYSPNTGTIARWEAEEKEIGAEILCKQKTRPLLRSRNALQNMQQRIFDQKKKRTAMIFWSPNLQHKSTSTGSFLNN